MFTRDDEFRRGFAELRLALWHALDPRPALSPAFTPALAGSPALNPASASTAGGSSRLLSEAVDYDPRVTPAGGSDGPGHGSGASDADLAVSSAEDAAEASRLIALVELARGGDGEAFGLLYDHYHVAVYRFVYYRVGSVALAEDLTSETFFRALRGMASFRWQGKDFGAWLMTIARNLCTDHFKAGRTRLEQTTEDMGVHDDATEGPENAVMAGLTNELLLDGLRQLSDEQRDCLIMRFLQGLSIAETAEVLGRSEGAVKQLQLRGVRNLAKLLPAGWRDD
jgi:RNA polymerase sigma-70 factor (ECF subfamily)